MKVSVCFSPVLYPYYVDNNDIIVVVVDVFRATTSMCMAFENGASSIIPVATLEEAKLYKDKGYLVGGERNIVKFEFGDFGNSPTEYVREKVEGKDIVISTTNGTQAIDRAKDASCLLIGSFANLDAIVNFCKDKNKDVLVLCAGFKNQINIEDTLYGGALIEGLQKKANFKVENDPAVIALEMWNNAKSDINQYIEKSEHIKRMKSHGLYEIALFCLRLNTIDIVPVYNKIENRIRLQK